MRAYHMKPRVWWLVVAASSVLVILCSLDAEAASSVDAKVAEADALRKRGDLDSAISVYTDAIRLDPKNIMAHIGRGLAYSGKATSAMPDLSAIGTEADYEKAMAGPREAMKKANADFGEAIRIDKKAVEAYVARRVAAGKRPQAMVGPHDELTALQIALYYARVHEIEANLKEADLYEPVGETLILYCQSDPNLFPNPLGPAWFPAALGKQGRFRVTVNAKYGLIEFGSGFYHFGYTLTLDKASSTPTSNTWKLFLHREDLPGTLLFTKSVPPTHSLTAEELLKRVLRGYDDILAKEPFSDGAYQDKVRLLLRFDHAAEARGTCKTMLEKLPDNSWANITCALITATERSDDEAEQVLSAWAEKNPSFFDYLVLAYYFKLRGQPGKAAAALLKAAKHDVNTAGEHGGSCLYRGYAAALYAARNGEYDAAIKVCDRLLPVKEHGDFLKRSLRDLKTASEKMAKGEKGHLPPSNRLGNFNLFEPDFVDRLLRHSDEDPQ